ncbi:MAG: hypothetical protein IJI14_15995 [Anaerolineaceae bacterium]|nr:hypothetical protein [Anaerolineaceae bacterium]
MKKYIALFTLLLSLVSVVTCFAFDGTSDQLMAMLQQKMEEVAKLTAENESLKAQLQECKSNCSSCANPDNIVRTQQQPANNGACRNEAEFIDDITIPDGTKVAPGAAFTKTWRLKNIGTCTWTPSYQVVSVGRFRMGGQQYAYLPKAVAPGQTVDISMNVVAPTFPDDYASEYRLQDASGNLFGITGTRSKQELSFWLKIVVEDNAKCALVSSSPASVYRNGEFDAVFKIKNNSGSTWTNDFDIRMTDGKGFLKYDKSYIDIPKSVDPGDTLTLIYDMVASDEGGNHGIKLELIKDGGVFCTINSMVTFR